MPNFAAFDKLGALYYYREVFLMYQVTKRDGKVVDFEITKIAEAIRKALRHRTNSITLL